MDLVQSSNGTTQRERAYTDQWRGGQTGGQKRKRPSEKGRKETRMSLVPSYFTQTDVSGVKGESRIFSNMMFCILSFKSKLAKV